MVDFWGILRGLKGVFMAMVITKKVLGNGVTPPPLLGKIPKKYRFFWKSPLSEISRPEVRIQYIEMEKLLRKDERGIRGPMVMYMSIQEAHQWWGTT